MADHSQRPRRPMRRIALWTDLPEASRELVEKFVDARILIRDTRVLGEDGDGEQDVVEIALESLLKQWRELSGWLAEQAENLKAADVLLRDAERWRVNSFDEIYLYPRALLNQAERLAATSTFGRKLEPTRKFLVASRQAVTDQQHEREAMLRRNTVRLASLLAITVVVAAVAVFAFFAARHAKEVADHNAQDATAQKLVSEANAMLTGTGKGGDRQAFEQLLAANRLAAHPNERPMLDALVRRSSTDLIRAFPFPVVGVSVADAKQRLAATDTKSVHVWDTADPNWHESLRGDGQSLPVPDNTLLTSLAMSADGQHLAAGTNDGVVLVWDLGEDPAAAKPIGAKHNGRVTAVAISRDGRQVASTGADGVIDMAHFDGTGAHSITVGTELFAVAFDPSGRRLAAGGTDGALRLGISANCRHSATASPPASRYLPMQAAS